MAEPISSNDQKMLRFRWIYLLGTFGFLMQATNNFLAGNVEQDFLGFMIKGWILGILFLILSFVMVQSFLKYHKLHREQIKNEILSRDELKKDIDPS